MGMSAAIIKALNLLVLAAGLLILYFCKKANPTIFSFGTHIIIQIWMSVILAYFAISAINKFCILFNKQYFILPVISFTAFGLFLIGFFAPLFITLPKVNTSYTGHVVFVMLGWMMWDVFMLSIHAHSVYKTDKDGS
jgi:hypothetical protein